jgi:4-hydroxythreonine-4-phosphate dehydrogenase
MTGDRLLGVTVGDMAGVGPELALRCLPHALPAGHRPVLLGHAGSLQRAALDLQHRGVHALPPDAVRRVASVGEARHLPPGTLAVLDCMEIPLPDTDTGWPWGQAVPDFGSLQHAALRRGVALALRGELTALCTLPWHKKRLQDAGLPPTGHTEVLQQEAGVARVLMVLAGDLLRVALATTHVPLRQVADLLTVEDLCDQLLLFHQGLQAWGLSPGPIPRIAVCGLNPHAGEEGVLGHEEETILKPALLQARALGVDASGPWPADTLFPRLISGAMQADGVLAMYHDQGLGPLKSHHFGAAVNLTFGLPFRRTSVDHGTAYDIAGRGQASDASFRLALQMACGG